MRAILTDPAAVADRHEANNTLLTLYDGAEVRACDVPRHAWAHLLHVCAPQTPPRRADVQARMDALAADIEKESTS